MLHRRAAVHRWTANQQFVRVHRPSAAVRQTNRPRLITRASASAEKCCSGDLQADRGDEQPVSSHIVAYGHPDAARRRHEAELRKQLRAQDLQELRAAGLEWWGHLAPDNMCTVSTREEYDRALLQCKALHGLVVVDFFAPWCAGCRRLYPKLRQIAAANLDVAFIKVNTDAEEMMHLSQELGVTGLPYFNLHAGHKVQAFAANLSKIGRLRTEISALKDLLAEQAAQASGVLHSIA